MNVIMTEELLIPLSLAKFAIPISATGKRFINLNPSISIDPLPNRSSKLLGSPYWPKSVDFYPKDKNGDLMILLAQINFKDIDFRRINSFDDISVFPTSGILQFFTTAFKYEDNLSCQFKMESIKQEKDFMVVFHQSDDLPSFSNPGIDDINNIANLNNFTALKHCNLSFDFDFKYCPISDSYFSSCFYDNFIQSLSFEDREEFFLNDEFDSSGCKMGGYPLLYKKDPIGESFDVNNPWILLLQIDSSDNEKFEPVSIFGDGGVAHWFIKKNDLINRDFSNVLFFWDLADK